MVYGARRRPSEVRRGSFGGAKASEGLGRGRSGSRVGGEMSGAPRGIWGTADSKPCHSIV